MSLVLSPSDLRSLREVFGLLATPLEFGSASEWRERVLHAIRPLFDADAAALVIPHEGEPPVTLLDRPQSYLDEYLEYQALEAAVDYIVEHREPVACTLTASGGDRAVFKESELYALVYRHYRINDAIWCMLDLTDEPPVVGPGRVFAPGGVAFTGVLSLYSERPDKPRFREDGLALMALIRPGLRAAAQTWTDFAGRRRARHQFIDESTEALAICDRSGAITHRNPALALLLASEPAGATIETAIRAMASALGKPADDAGHLMARASRALEHALTAGRDRYVLRATSIEALVGVPGAIQVHVRRLTTRRPRVETLRRRYALTERESQVALLLAEGKSNRGIGETLGISEHTARRHTEKVLAKLRLTSRSQVAHLLASGEELETHHWP